jgi:hypothetical protein
LGRERVDGWCFKFVKNFKTFPHPLPFTTHQQTTYFQLYTLINPDSIPSIITSTLSNTDATGQPGADQRAEMTRLAFQCLHLLTTHLQHSSKPLAALKTLVEAVPERLVAPLVPAMVAVAGRLQGVGGCEEEVSKLREALGWRFGEEIFSSTTAPVEKEDEEVLKSPSKEDGGVRRSERKRRRSVNDRE